MFLSIDIKTMVYYLSSLCISCCAVMGMNFEFYFVSCNLFAASWAKMALFMVAFTIV